MLAASLLLLLIRAIPAVARLWQVQIGLSLGFNDWRSLQECVSPPNVAFVGARTL